MCAGVIRADDRRRTPPFSPPFTVQKDVTTTSLKGGRFFFCLGLATLFFMSEKLTLLILKVLGCLLPM